MIHLVTGRAVLLVLLPLLWQSITLAEETSLVADLYANPPPPCLAKGIEDRSSLIAIDPSGSTREELVGIMGSMASIFLDAGANHMTARNIETVYTAVFFEDEPVNEIGIYAYKFRDQIDQSMFSPREEPGGKFFVIDRNLLVLLWREQSVKTTRCFSALDGILGDKL